MCIYKVNRARVRVCLVVQVVCVRVRLECVRMLLV
jgi:hypothetical protein